MSLSSPRTAHGASAPSPIKARVTAEEWDTRVELAACYHLVAMNRWDNGIATHISARVPGEEAFLINPFGLFFEEVTASNLIKVNLAGEILLPTEHKVNVAGFVVHSAVHEARADAVCVMHLHTSDGMAVSCLSEGLLPLTQTAMLICRQTAYHEFEGPAVDLAERARLGTDLGAFSQMILRNHGTLTVGRSIGEAFVRMSYLEKACEVQMKVLAAGHPLHPVTIDAQDRTANHMANASERPVWPAWTAWRRRLDRSGAIYDI